jgi:hypothetical protein
MTRIAVIAAAAVAALGLTSFALAGSDGAKLSGPFVGFYEATLTPAQALTRGDPRLAGKFQLVLGSNGLYVMANSFDGPSAGQLAVLPGHRLRFFNDIGCTAGRFERPGGGIYSWSLNGNRLTLRLVREGPCSGRTDTLTFPTWTRLD